MRTYTDRRVRGSPQGLTHPLTAGWLGMQIPTSVGGTPSPHRRWTTSGILVLPSFRAGERAPAACVGYRGGVCQQVPAAALLCSACRARCRQGRVPRPVLAPRPARCRCGHGGAGARGRAPCRARRANRRALQGVRCCTRLRLHFGSTCVARQPNGDRRAFSRLPSPGADVAGVSPVVVQMWHCHPKARRGVVEADGHADVVACCAWGMEGVSAWLRSHTQRR